MSKVIYLPPPKPKPVTRAQKLKALAAMHRLTADLLDDLRRAEVSAGKNFDESIRSKQ